MNAGINNLDFLTTMNTNNFFTRLENKLEKNKQIRLRFDMTSTEMSITNILEVYNSLDNTRKGRAKERLKELIETTADLINVKEKLTTQEYIDILDRIVAKKRSTINNVVKALKQINLNNHKKHKEIFDLLRIRALPKNFNFYNFRTNLPEGYENFISSLPPSSETASEMFRRNGRNPNPAQLLRREMVTETPRGEQRRPPKFPEMGKKVTQSAKKPKRKRKVTELFVPKFDNLSPEARRAVTRSQASFEGRLQTRKMGQRKLKQGREEGRQAREQEHQEELLQAKRIGQRGGTRTVQNSRGVRDGATKFPRLPGQKRRPGT